MLEMTQYTMSNLRTLTQQLTELSSHIKSQQIMLDKLTEAQANIVPMVDKLGNAAGGASEQYTQAMYEHLQSIDTSLQHLAEDFSKGRDQSVKELRHEIMSLTQTILKISRGK